MRKITMLQSKSSAYNMNCIELQALDRTLVSLALPQNCSSLHPPDENPPQNVRTDHFSLAISHTSDSAIVTQQAICAIHSRRVLVFHGYLPQAHFFVRTCSDHPGRSDFDRQHSL